MASPFSDSQRKNLLDSLETDLRSAMDEGSLSYDKAFIQVALDCLGYDTENGTISDGPGDFGVDYWEVGPDRATLIQFKCHDYSERFNANYTMKPDHLSDLRDMRDVLENLDATPKSANTETKRFITSARDAIHEVHNLNIAVSLEEQQTYMIDRVFVGLAARFSEQAKDELDNILSFDRFVSDSVNVDVVTKSFLIDGLLAEKWRSANTAWRNNKGQKQIAIDISVVDGHEAIISEANWCVFFGKAIDLVKAYKALGYQIFEPNVRCELRTSKINKEIKKSVETKLGRENFKHLNNGITIACDTFKKPSKNKPAFTLIHPGVINGLQTVKSLHDAYMDLDAAGKTEFTEQCEVLIRLHSKGSVKDVNSLIRATNNQNPMQPRNLRSNDPEQVSYQRSFADLGWFYARKEQEWNAFRGNEKAWSQLGGKRVRHFSAARGHRRIDNLDLAQAYFAFIGFTTESLNKKRYIFDDEDIYNIVFKCRLAKHGYDYGLTFAKNKTTIFHEASNDDPPPALMLISYLSRDAAKEFSTNQKTLRSKAISRLGLVGKPVEEINAAITSDTDYIRDYVIRGTIFLFVELVGFVLYRSLGRSIYQKANVFLTSRSMKQAFEDYDYANARSAIDGNTYEDDDLLVVLWLMYCDIIEAIVLDPSWLTQWRTTSNRSGFHYSEQTRRKILDWVLDYEKVANRRGLTKAWSGGIDDRKSIFDYVKGVLA